MNIRKKKLGAFKDELIALYRRHGVSIGHEDSQGAFIIRDYRDADVRWILAATNEATDSEAVEAPETRIQVVNRSAAVIRDVIDRNITDLTGIEVLYILTQITHSYSVDAIRVERADRKVGE